MIKGIGASNGIAIGKAYKLDMPDLTVVKTTISDVEAENQRFINASAKVRGDLEKIKEFATVNLSEEEAMVFDAHMLVLSDPELVDGVANSIKSNNVNAEVALDEITNAHIAFFESMDDEYFRERAADIKDVKRRLMAALMGKDLPNPSEINEEVVIIAHDLTPSDTAQLNKNLVRGFATDIGGRTSHSAILARSMEIPAVVATNTVTQSVNNGDFVIMDGSQGIIIINPSNEEITEYIKKRDAFIEYRRELKALKNEKSVTKDNYHVELAANIGSPKDLESVLENGAEGVGLYRTEFLYMESANLPTEEEQYSAYKEVLEGMAGKPVVVRTLDIGGDKELAAIEMPKEMNPFLGVRAIRLCFQREDIFRTQLRALLRASVYGNLRIMFPMIATLDEFRKAKKILLEEKEKLVSESIPVSNDFQVGIMIEIPAAAVLADQFAKEVDFFSIGTNDLIQYTFAADRMSTSISYLYQPYNPAILRLIKNVIDASHKEGKWTGMCGEMAGELMAAPLLIGLGLDEFSMSATSILGSRKLIRELNKSEMNKLASEALEKGTYEEVVELVKKYTGITE